MNEPLRQLSQIIHNSAVRRASRIKRYFGATECASKNDGGWEGDFTWIEIPKETNVLKEDNAQYVQKPKLIESILGRSHSKTAHFQLSHPQPKASTRAWGFSQKT